MGFGMTPKEVRKIAFDFCEENGISNNFDSDNKIAGDDDWFSGFRKRHPNITLRKPTGLSSARANFMKREVVRYYFKRLKSALKSTGADIDVSHVYICDEPVTSELTPYEYLVQSEDTTGHKDMDDQEDPDDPNFSQNPSEHEDTDTHDIYDDIGDTRVTDDAREDTGGTMELSPMASIEHSHELVSIPVASSIKENCKGKTNDNKSLKMFQDLITLPSKNVKFPNEHQLLIWLDPHRMSIVVMVVYRSLSSKTVKEVIAMGGGGGNYDARGVGEGVISDDGCIIQNQGIQTVINLQESGEHASCGKPLEKSGFTYDPDIFMESSIYYYNFKWKDYGFANTNFILDIVKVISFALTQGKIAIHCHAVNQYAVSNIDDLWQANLNNIQSLSKYNFGVVYTHHHRHV
ncbi:unnamed protein product [Timema podura]|uniref:HTH CENPB-type domain-containing protein n=1 Tax=Timema podura TaxID=61482 RepID=A0ABN7NRS4_TIMPD|nr:unnamed protein product [Timema podura]